MTNKEKILVTGGAGFIGSNFIRYLLKNDPKVNLINYDALTYAGNLENISDLLNNKRHIFIKGDIRDKLALETLFKENNISGVINFAAESHVDRSLENPEDFISTNIIGTINLLQNAKKYGINRFLQISTDEVYGSLTEDAPPFTENSPIQPNSPYSASKAAADHFVRAYNHSYGLNTIITRCSNNYGPYQFPEKMIPLCINNAFNNKKIPVYGDGMQIRDWLYVEDHCEAIWLAFKEGKTGEIYNIGGNCQIRNIELVKIILRECGKDESLISFVKDRPGHDKRYAMDFSKIKNELGWSPKYNFDEAIKKTIKWYSEHKNWLNNLVSGAYMEYYEKMYKNR
ncbi:MAG TPA: dTDP-glucose 4,6-dehydratase [Victivallales bacterium]|nr:dTDP-glucose 4,6-dehydratase [Victivallales bacterium]HRR06102.1 dTDP-glucose 4,6-dehydratase [Victivallales bacterium]